MPTWPTLVTGCALCGVIGYAAAQATRDALPGLTAEDRLEIQELLHRYMFVLDSCPDHNSGYDYADLYTEDGQFASQDVQFGMTVTGRDALGGARRQNAQTAAAARSVGRGPTNQVHLNLAPIIEAAPEALRAFRFAHDRWPWSRGLLERLVSRRLCEDREGLALQEPAACGRGCRWSASRTWRQPAVSGERQPTPAGSRSLVGASEPKPEPLAGDPLKWLTASVTETTGR